MALDQDFLNHLKGRFDKMSHTIEIIPESMFIVHYSGRLTLDERMETVQEIKYLSKSSPLRTILVNFKESESVLEVEEMQKLGQIYAQSLFGWKAAWVIDRPTDPVNGYIKRIAEKHGVEIIIFDSEEAAHEWCS
jgi:hypothetical protein